MPAEYLDKLPRDTFNEIADLLPMRSILDFEQTSKGSQEMVNAYLDGLVGRKQLIAYKLDPTTGQGEYETVDPNTPLAPGEVREGLIDAIFTRPLDLPTTDTRLKIREFHKAIQDLLTQSPGDKADCQFMASQVAATAGPATEQTLNLQQFLHDFVQDCLYNGRLFIDQTKMPETATVSTALDCWATGLAQYRLQ
jgi:hypothetical protein